MFVLWSENLFILDELACIIFFYELDMIIVVFFFIDASEDTSLVLLCCLWGSVFILAWVLLKLVEHEIRNSYAYHLLDIIMEMISLASYCCDSIRIHQI